MAQQPDINAILAALAAQNSGSTPVQTSQPQFPSLPQPPGNPLSNFPLPQPNSTGAIDLNAIKPVSSGSVSIHDAIAKAKAIAQEKGLTYDSRGPSSARPPSGNYSSNAYSGYGRSRSRSRSPRRDRDAYSSYRDERRSGNFRSPSPIRSPRGRYGRERTPPHSAESGSAESDVLTIDSRMVGLIIGRNGENLRRIESDTGARVQFMTGPDGGSRRQCRLSGTVRQRKDAKRELMKTVDENGGDSSQAIQGADLPSSGRTSRPNNSGSNSTAPPAKEGETNIQILVPDRTVGLIIGRGGETIRDLQDRSGCHVNIVGENMSINGMRPVNLIGNESAAAKARQMILEIVESDTRPGGTQPSKGPDPLSQPGPDKITENIMVPSTAVGMIIGRGGETVKEMQNQTQCKINIFQPSGADIERKIELIGNRRAIEHAKEVIWNKVDEARDKNGAGRRGGGRDREGDRSNDSFHASGANATPTSQQQPASGGDNAGGADPYAPWGGYNNYVAMWYAALAQSGQQPGQQSGQQPPAPGAPNS